MDRNIQFVKDSNQRSLMIFFYSNGQKLRPVMPNLDFPEIGPFQVTEPPLNSHIIGHGELAGIRPGTFKSKF